MKVCLCDVLKFGSVERSVHCGALPFTENGDTFEENVNLRLKGGGNKKSEVKHFASNEHLLNVVLTSLRSTNVFQFFNEHAKCSAQICCSFCLLRSTITKVNLESGRRAVIPVEVECQRLKETSMEILLQRIILNAFNSLQVFSSAFLPEWKCTCCQDKITERGYLINLDHQSGKQVLRDLIKVKYKSLMKKHEVEAGNKIGFHRTNFEMKLNTNQKTCIFSSSGMEVDLLELIPFGGRIWKCVGLVSCSRDSFFHSGYEWFKVKDKNVEKQTETNVSNVKYAVYDEDCVEEKWKSEKLCYTGKDLTFLRNKIKDRHLPTEERNQDRHLPTEKRKEHDAEDRHLPGQDRHLPTEERNQDRHSLTEKRKQNNRERYERYNRLKKEKELLTDTAMERICISCIEWKSMNSCVIADKVHIERLYKFCVESDLTRSPDSKFYVCITCKLSIDKNKEPTRSQKEILGLLSYPEELIEELEAICTPWTENEKKDPEKKFTVLNRVEEHMLKLVIPFIRIGHLPRSRYFQLRGHLIMVSADVEESLNSILPVNQNLIPIALKRKFEYPGYFIREYVDRNKIKHYFEWFRQHNHLFQNCKLDDDRIEEFERKSMKIVETVDNEKNDIIINHEELLRKKELVNLDSDEELEEETGTKLEVEHNADHSSVIINKYCEDTKTKTVANRFSDYVFIFEKSNASFKDDFLTIDPEDAVYVEDELSSDEDEYENENEDLTEDFSEEDITNSHKLKDIRKESRQSIFWLRSNIENLCKCGIERKLSQIMELQYQLQQIDVNQEKLVALKATLIGEFSEVIMISRNRFKEMNKNCHHKQSDISHDIKNVVEGNKLNPELTASYISQQIKNIKDNVETLEIAPTDQGKFINWQSEVFLEEKLFPDLFPYGIGGFLSSNMLKQNNMGFSNYIKNRLLSADPKFRNNAAYCFFLLLVKELTDMKRSEVTYVRKATRVAGLTAQKVNAISKEHLFRYDNAYSAFKTIRGTSMYYQDVKKRLMACLRQNGAPTLFTTYSCAEFSWNSLIKSIYETTTKKQITLEEIAKKPAAWRNKLVSENVVQSTLHFSKRTDKIMSLLTNKGIFFHDEKHFVADSFFYRVEFQARGAPHIHCLLWLKSDDDILPPSLWNESKHEEKSIEEQIASFADSVMSGSSTDMNCEIHNIFDHQCEECLLGKELVEKFQSHSHKATCRKKGKVMKIFSTEGHGRLDKVIEGDELTVPVCRLRHPKFPMDKTAFIRPFLENVDESELKKAKYDYKRIKKYLLRITNGDKFKESESWKSFRNLSFNQFLYEVGMLDEKDLLGNRIIKAKERYLNALRCEVKSSGLLLLKRKTADILTNNFNKKLIKIHQANQDIQFICDEYAVAEYITNYLTKNEAGMSGMLKTINEEAVKEGEDVMKTIKKLATALDKGREMSIQEAIYRSLGLKMTKFRDVVRFINTNHPDRREGLLKSNLEELDEDEKIFHNSMHDYYQLRPYGNDDEQWDIMCLADFASHYNIAYKSSSKNAIELLDGKSFIIKRGRPCVIRYFLKYDNEEEYYRALCILFLPFRDEKKIHKMDMKTLYLDNKELIEKNRSNYEKHKTIIDLIENSERENSIEIDNEMEEDSEYIEEETTDEKDIKDFEECLKKEAQKVLSNFNGPNMLMKEDEYLDMVCKLNSQQRTILNDFVERIESQKEDEQFYLFIGGEAGTGKSFLLKAMINASKKRGKRSGAELDKPVCLTLAPTGVAAYLVNGTTIESGLGIQPTYQKAYLKNQASRNSNLRFLYEDLLVIFVDEISMVGSDQLAKMNYRLQDIMGNSLFMGGVSMVVTGDFGQLPPVGQRMIWETSYLDNRCDISPKHFDEHFKIFYLDMKMRSQDLEFSNICDQVRKGIADEDIVDYFNKNIGNCPCEDDNSMYAEGKLCIIVTTNAAREKINNEKLEQLLPDKREYYANAIDKSTNNPNAPEIDDKIPLTRTGQLQKRIIFKEEAPVMITSNSSKAKYKNNGIVNGARGKIDSIQASETDPQIAEVVWVKFNDEKIGQLLRLDSKHLLEKHKPKDSLAVPITRQKKQFRGKGNTEYLRDQFPLTLCYAVTAHKSQGQTLDDVIIDFSGESRISNGSFYTAISRVKFGKNLYLRDFNPSYIKANAEVEKKMEAMKIFNKYNFKKTYNHESIYIDNENEIKIGYININDIQAGRSLQFLNDDKNLIALDFLAISDTRLNQSITNEYLSLHLSNWMIEGRFDSNDNVKHMGMLLLKSKECAFQNILEKIEEKRFMKKGMLQIQVIHFSFSNFQLKSAAVYARKTPTQEEIQMLKEELKNDDLIMGDLNLEANRGEDLKKLQELCEEKSRILNEITTSRFDQLDHVLLNCRKFEFFFSTSFINFTTDHHAIVARIAKSGNKFNSKYLEKISCNDDIRTFHPKSKQNEPKLPTRKENVDKKYKKTDSEDFSKTQTEPKPKVRNENVDKKFKKPASEDHSKEHTKSEERSENINLSCLFSPNWLNDEVIDKYLELLSKIDGTIFMYTTYFHQAFSSGGFSKVENYYRRNNPLSFRKIIIPVHQGSHWFLITFSGDELITYDPYNYPGASNRKKEELLKQNLYSHLETLKNLRDNYFKPLYRKYEKPYNEIALKVMLPPDIPAQNNSHDCGVFLLAFAKHIVLTLRFDFCGDDMIDYRNSIREEFEKGGVSSYVEYNSTTFIPKKEAKRKKDNIEGKEQRRIINPDLETCWLNSCLQLVLTALDYMDEDSFDGAGSYLWNALAGMRKENTSTSLDPTEIKNLLIRTERTRLIVGNIRQQHSLFDLQNIPALHGHEGEAGRGRIGQQDCKDFFYCLDENRGNWEDVFALFKTSTLTSTECSLCKNVSMQEVSGNESTLITLDCPDTSVSIKNYLEDKMNGSEYQEWRDETGCGKLTQGKISTKITNVKNSKFLIVNLTRLIRIGQTLHIIDTEVNVYDEEVTIKDINGEAARFAPIAIIHHSGNVSRNQTQGHYRADVKNRISNTWYRTSDNDLPKKLSNQSLTRMGYIFLFKQSNTETMEVPENENKPFMNVDGVFSTESSFEDGGGLAQIIRFLNTMNLDLVFEGIVNLRALPFVKYIYFIDFEELRQVEMDWLASLNFTDKIIKSSVDELGTRWLLLKKL